MRSFCTHALSTDMFVRMCLLVNRRGVTASVHLSTVSRRQFDTPAHKGALALTRAYSSDLTVCSWHDLFGLCIMHMCVVQLMSSARACVLTSVCLKHALKVCCSQQRLCACEFTDLGSLHAVTPYSVWMMDLILCHLRSGKVGVDHILCRCRQGRRHVTRSPKDKC